MKNTIFSVLALGLTLSLSPAQTRSAASVGLPFLKKQDFQKLKQQSDEFYSAIQPTCDRVGKQSVNVFSAGYRVARGTVTEHGVITKWSELVSRGDKIWVVGHDGVKRDAFVKAVYLDYDLALLDYGGGLPAVELASQAKPELGAFLISVGPSLQAHGFGVLSVMERSLKDSDQAYLGVFMDDQNILDDGGVLLGAVEPGSAADRAGLRAGDLISKINGKPIAGALEMSNLLRQKRPGDRVDLIVNRGQKEYSAQVILAARPEIEQYTPQRMLEMERMGGSINEVADGFPGVIQSDMQIDKEDAGAPVYDIEGNFLGVVVARGSRVKTFIMPAEKLAKRLSEKPDMEVSAEQKSLMLEQRNSGLSSEQAEEIRQLRDAIKRMENRIMEIQGAQ